MGISRYAFNISTATKSSYYTALNIFFFLDTCRHSQENVSHAEITKHNMSVKYKNNGLFFLFKESPTSLSSYFHCYRVHTGALRSSLYQMVVYTVGCVFRPVADASLSYYQRKSCAVKLSAADHSADCSFFPKQTSRT